MSQSKPENQIDYIEFPASDIENTKKFYNSVFGWKFEDYGPAYTGFHDGRLGGGFTKDLPAPGKGILIVEPSQTNTERAGGNLHLRDAVVQVNERQVRPPVDAERGRA